MRRLAVMCVLAMGAYSSLACAHAHLLKSLPAEGSVLATPPRTLVLTFNEPARLTALSIQRSGEAKQVIGSLPDAASATLSIDLPALTAGVYTVSWRVVSDDGHIMPGTFHFTVGRAARP